MIARARVLLSKPETPSVHTIRITKPSGFNFQPVQFVGLEFPTEQGPEEYSMSLACSPTKDYLEFGARISRTPWKRAFQALKPGDEVEIDGPYGHFVLDETHDAIFVAGGVGITPLKGMIQYVNDRGLPVRMVLLYSSRSTKEIAYRDEVDGLAHANPSLRVVHTLTRPEPEGLWKGRTGRIDRALLEEAARGLKDPVFYICGAPSMVESMLEGLRSMGLTRARVKWEEFWGYE